jgi:dUTP pyrophosphatase
MEIKVLKLEPGARIPTKQNPTDSGWDLYSNAETTFYPFETRVVPTGLAFGVPKGHEIQIRGRSGVSVKTALKVLLGTVDQSYIGHVGIIVQNVSDKIVTIPSGYKLAQAVLSVIPISTISEVTELQDTSRGTSGFGSSGV